MPTQPPTARPRAFSYLRFSTPEQLKGDSFRRQHSMAVDYAARHGLDLDQSLTFRDLGVSAFKGANAETGQLGAFLEAVRAGLVPHGSFLLVEALDRLSRLTPRKALRVLEDIVGAGVTVVTLNDGKQYTEEGLDSDHMGLIMAVVYFMRANEESATKSRRLSQAWAAKREAATSKPLTSVVPAWIRLDREAGRLELIPERAEVVRGIFSSYVGGGSLHGIADDLNKRSVPCFGRAQFWHRSYVTKILSNPAAQGDYIPHQRAYEGAKRVRVPLDPIANYYPAVVSRETFASAQALRSAGAAHTPKVRVGQVVNLFAGLAACPLCGSTMTRVRKGSRARAGQPVLVCTKAKAGVGCQYHAVRLPDLEEVLLRKMGQLVAEAPSGAEDLDDQLAALESELEGMLDLRSNLVDAIARSGGSDALLARLRELEEAEQDARARLDAAQEQFRVSFSPVLAARLRALEEAATAAPLDPARVNAALRSVLRRVVIDYPTGNLVFDWKHGGESRLMAMWPTPARAAA